MLSLIVAYSKRRVIGINNRLPWKLPNDLNYFKEQTMGKTVVMGRKTFESLGKPLPGRKNIVLTRDKNWRFNGVEVIHTLEELRGIDEEVMIIGGANIYQQAIPIVDKMYITKINHHFDGDSYFPEFSMKEWRRLKKVRGEKDEKNPYDYFFEVYEKRKR